MCHMVQGTRAERTGLGTVLGMWQCRRRARCSTAQRSAAQEELLKGKGKRARERDPRWAVVVMSGV